MAIVGPWAIAVYKGKVDWGVVPVPTAAGMPAIEIHTFSDAKNVGMYASCKNQGTAWDFLKFTTTQEQDGQLLQIDRPDAAAQGPADDLRRTTSPRTRTTSCSRDQAARTVEVPNVPNSVEIWQTFRDAYTKSVIFGDRPRTFTRAATIDALAAHEAVASSLVTASQTEGRPTTPGRPARRRLGPDPRASHPIGMLLVAPYVVFIAVVFAYPLGVRGLDVLPRLLLHRARRRSCDRPFVGLDNYKTVLTDPAVLPVVRARRRSSWSSTCR